MLQGEDERCIEEREHCRGAIACVSVRSIRGWLGG